MRPTFQHCTIFFLQTVVAKFAHDQDQSSAQKARSSVFGPLLVLWHGGQTLQGLQVMCVESGTLDQGKGEAVAVKEKKGKCGRKRIETMMSRRSLKKMTNRVVFVFE